MVPVVSPESRFSPSSFNCTPTNPVVSILVDFGPIDNRRQRNRRNPQFGAFFRDRPVISPPLLPNTKTLTPPTPFTVLFSSEAKREREREREREKAALYDQPNIEDQIGRNSSKIETTGSIRVKLKHEGQNRDMG